MACGAERAARRRLQLRYALHAMALVGLLVVASTVWLFAAPPDASASAPADSAAPGLSAVQPGPDGYFEYTLAPGTSRSGSVQVENPTSAPATYDLYPADAGTSPDTGVAYGEAQSSTEGAAAWVTLQVSTLQLKPKARQTVHFVVTVPPGASPGQHVAAIGAQSPSSTGKPEPVAGGGSVSLITSSRAMIAVVVDVPGPAANTLRLGHPSVGVEQNHTRQILSIPMANTGDLLTKPRLSGTIHPCATTSSTLVDVHRQLDTMVPHTAIDYPWYLKHALGIGCYTAHLRLAVGKKVLTRFNGNLTVGSQATVQNPSHLPFGMSWQLAAADVVALLLSFTGLIVVIWRRRRPVVH